MISSKYVTVDETTPGDIIMFAEAGMLTFTKWVVWIVVSKVQTYDSVGAKQYDITFLASDLRLWSNVYYHVSSLLTVYDENC